MIRHDYDPDFRIDPSVVMGDERPDGDDYEMIAIRHETAGYREGENDIPTGPHTERTTDPNKLPVIGDRNRPSDDDYYARKLARLADK